MEKEQGMQEKPRIYEYLLCQACAYLSNLEGKLRNTTSLFVCLIDWTHSIGRKVGIPRGILLHIKRGLVIGIQISLTHPSK